MIPRSLFAIERDARFGATDKVRFKMLSSVPCRSLLNLIEKTLLVNYKITT